MREPTIPETLSMSHAFQYARHEIAVRLDPSFTAAGGWLRDEVKDWCHQELTDHVEKLTSDPHRPLAVYFVSDEESARFRAQWMI